MKKKVMMCILAILLSFIIVGCVNNGAIDNDESNDNNENINENTNVEETIDNFDLYSDDTKIVFNYMGVYQIVYYHTGDTITGLEWYYNYENSETVSYMVAGIKASIDEDDNVESVKQKGKYVIVKFKEEEYKDMSLEQVKQSYSYLEEVKNNN